MYVCVGGLSCIYCIVEDCMRKMKEGEEVEERENVE